MFIRIDLPEDHRRAAVLIQRLTFLSQFLTRFDVDHWERIWRYYEREATPDLPYIRGLLRAFVNKGRAHHLASGRLQIRKGESCLTLDRVAMQAEVTLPVGRVLFYPIFSNVPGPVTTDYFQVVRTGPAEFFQALSLLELVGLNAQAMQLLDMLEEGMFTFKYPE